MSNASLCDCENGWSGVSDFVLATGVQCHISRDAILGLWGANLFCTFLMLLYSAPRIRAIVRRFLQRKAELAQRNKPLYLSDNKGLLSVVVGFSLTYPFLIAVGLMRIFVPSAKIGIDPFITVCWFMTRVGFCAASAIHQPYLIAEMLKARNLPPSLIKRNVFYTRILFELLAVSTFICMLPVLITQGQNILLARTFFALWCLGQAALFLSFALNTRHLALTVFNVLSTSTNTTQNQNVIMLRDKLAKMQKSQYLNTGIQTVIFTSFLCAPPLWILHDYLLPLSWFGLITLGKELIDSVTIEKTVNYQSEVRGMHSEGALQQVPELGRASTAASTNPAAFARSTPVSKDDSKESQYGVTSYKSLYESDVLFVDEFSPELIDTSPTWNAHRTLTSVVGGNSQLVVPTPLDGTAPATQEFQQPNAAKSAVFDKNDVMIGPDDVGGNT